MDRLHLVQKSSPEIIEFEKNVIKPKSKGSNFVRIWLKPIPREPAHKNFKMSKPDQRFT
jgi:hypothetical protein